MHCSDVISVNFSTETLYLEGSDCLFHAIWSSQSFTVGTEWSDQLDYSALSLKPAEHFLSCVSDYCLIETSTLIQSYHVLLAFHGFSKCSATNFSTEIGLWEKLYYFHFQIIDPVVFCRTPAGYITARLQRELFGFCPSWNAFGLHLCNKNIL